MKNVAQITREVLIEFATRDGSLGRPLHADYGDLDTLHEIATRANITTPKGRPSYFVTLRVLDHLDRHSKKPDSMFVKGFININRGVGGRIFCLKAEYHPLNITWGVKNDKDTIKIRKIK